MTVRRNRRIAAAPRLWRTTIVTATVALAAGGGIAAATIPDASRVVHTCYSTSTKPPHFYVIDADTQSCAPGDTELDLNQTGPAGPAGSVGPPGAQGPAGAGGEGGSVYTAGFSRSSGTGDETAEITATRPTSTVTLNLPAGSFVVDGALTASIGSSEFGDVVCRLIDSNDVGPFHGDQTGVEVGQANEPQALHTASGLAQVTTTSATPTVVTFACGGDAFRPASGSIQLFTQRVIATRATEIVNNPARPIVSRVPFPRRSFSLAGLPATAPAPVVLTPVHRRPAH